MATRRSHPPTLLTLAKRLLRDEALVERGMTVLVAVSGGPDSMALLHVMARLGPSMGFRVVAHGVDHGLRPEATAELGLARSLAERLNVPMDTSSLRVSEGGNLQARARDVRYQALREAAERAGAERIATGHHADDRAETVLMRLLQGSGPRGLGCLPPRQGALIRPFLRARRADVLAHLGRHGVEYAEDPSNKNSRFLRARVRAELMPLLGTLSPSVVEHLNRLADELLELEITASEGGLGRAQRRQVEAASRRGRRGVWVRSPGGQDLWVPVTNPDDMLSYRGTCHQESEAGDERSSTPAEAGGNLDQSLARSTTTTSVKVGPSKERP